MLFACLRLSGLVVDILKILERNFRKILGAIGELYQNVKYETASLKLDRYFVILK